MSSIVEKQVLKHFMGICNPSIFKNIFEDYNISVQRFLLSKGLEKAEVEDLVQESFLKLWRNCKTIELEKVKSYLFTVANNLSTDLFRKNKVRLKYKSSLSNKKAGTDGQYELEYQEFKEKLENALSSMNEKSREVFVLHRFDDMSYKKIAESLEIGVKAVEKRMGKALKHLYQQKILNKK